MHDFSEEKIDMKPFSCDLNLHLHYLIIIVLENFIFSIFRYICMFVFSTI